MLKYNSAFDVARVSEDCISWIKNWFLENGSDCKAVIGISGGKDSSVAAALCVRALGRDKVLGVLMPQGSQTDIDYSHRLCEHLGIESVLINIGEVASLFEKTVSEGLERGLSSKSKINFPARLRMSVLYAVSQSVKGRVANTCNLSENWVGYSTRYGDAAGDFSPLHHLTVQEVKAIGLYLGLPSEFIEKVPADGLTEKTDEENLGFSYKELDKYIREGLIENKEHKEVIDRLHKKNGFKLKEMPAFEPHLTV